MSRQDPAVLAVATASPPHRLAQHELREFARRFFAGNFPKIDRLLPAFDNSGIGERQMAQPIEWFDVPHSFVEKNEVYCSCALDMAKRAGAAAMAKAGVAADEIAALVFVSTTGISTPSLDSYLVQLLGMSRATARVPIWGLGCAGGAAGLARAADLTRALGRPVLLIASEVCSATFVHGDRSKSNLIATALFGDGAAAVVLAPVPEHAGGLRVLGSNSHLIDDSAGVMGWTLEAEGLRVRFARSIPEIVRKTVPDFYKATARAAAVEVSELEHFVVHPGGAKVLAAYEAALGIPRARIETAYQVLRAHGNMSSPTVLFVLERFMRDTPPTGAAGMVLGLGPGFAAEGVMFRW